MKIKKYFCKVCQKEISFLMKFTSLKSKPGVCTSCSGPREHILRLKFFPIFFLLISSVVVFKLRKEEIDEANAFLALCALAASLYMMYQKKISLINPVGVNKKQRIALAIFGLILFLINQTNSIISLEISLACIILLILTLYITRKRWIRILKLKLRNLGYQQISQ